MPTLGQLGTGLLRLRPNEPAGSGRTSAASGLVGWTKPVKGKDARKPAVEGASVQRPLSTPNRLVGQAAAYSSSAGPGRRCSRACACAPLLGLFSLITVWADRLAGDTASALRPNAEAWYRKDEPTFSDAIAAVRRVLWVPPNFSMSRQPGETVIIAASLLNRVFQTRLAA